MQFRANGKLLLSGEYLVLDGAKALAFPTKLGQRMQINAKQDAPPGIHWVSKLEDGSVWFEGRFGKKNNILTATDDAVAKQLVKLLLEATHLNPEFLLDAQSLYVETQLEFNREWGLGSSSTLIAMLAEWANVNPYPLLNGAFGGSGYDIACASHDQALIYQLQNGEPKFNEVSFSPPFLDQLWLVYLGKKQVSSQEIKRYKDLSFDREKAVYDINAITEEMLRVKNFSAFEGLILEHEQLMSGILQAEPVKQRWFMDFKGQVKSLGAWGGDFVLATAEIDPTAYFQFKGCDTVIPFRQMMKSY